MAKIITVDAGHGGTDGGASVYEGGKLKWAEKNLTLKITAGMNEFLTADSNYTPVMTRTSDIDLSVNKRIQICNDAKSDMMFAVHFNAGGGNGIEVYPNNPKESYYADSYRLAEFIVANMRDMTALRGINGIRYCYHIGNDKRLFAEYNDKNVNNYPTYYGVVRDTKCPAILVETAFIDNATDMARFDTDAELRSTAARYYRSICGYFGTTPIYDANGGKIGAVIWRVQVGAFSSKVNAEAFLAKVKAFGYTGSFLTQGTDGLWRVQVGAFSVKANAEAYMKDIKTKGYDAFIVQA